MVLEGGRGGGVGVWTGSVGKGTIKEELWCVYLMKRWGVLGKEGPGGVLCCVQM